MIYFAEICEVALKITADESMITGISFSEAENRSVGVPCPLIEKCVAELNEYFLKERSEFSIPFIASGTRFQMDVWREISRIPYGETRTYSDIAEALGNAKAVRAVGAACSKNPTVLLIPCHRVVGKNGSLTGFVGGIDLKRKLLNLEGGSF